MKILDERCIVKKKVKYLKIVLKYCKRTTTQSGVCLVVSPR